MAVFDNLQIKDTSANTSGKTIHIVNSASGKFKELNIYGESTQAAEPTPDSPQEIKSVVLSKIRTHKKNFIRSVARTINGNGIEFVIKENGTIIANGTSEARTTVIIFKGVLGAGSYVLSQGHISGGNSVCLTMAYTDESGAIKYLDLFNNTDGIAKFSFTKDTEVTVRADVRNAGMTIDNVTLYPQLEAGTTASEFESYTESIAALSEPITLNGLNGVQDYVDIKRGVLVQKFKEVVFDGSDDEKWVLPDSVSTRIEINLPDAKGVNNGLVANALCNQLKAISYLEVTADRINGISISSNRNCYIYTDLFDTTDLSLWKAHLASNPMTFIYELAEPIEMPLNAEDLAALNALETFFPITNVFNDANAEMQAEYFKNNNIGQDLADVHAIAADSHALVAEAQATAENAQEALASCLYIVSFNAESGELVTRSADYKG